MIHRTHDLSFDICQSREIIDKVRNDEVYAQNLYAALCNNEFREADIWEVLKDSTWCCSWRVAGSIIADIRGGGDYADWYCSGMQFYHDSDGYTPTPAENQYVPEGMITDEIRYDLAQIGWHPVDRNTEK